MLFVYLKESYHDLVYKVLECFNPKKFLMTVFSNKVIIEFKHSDNKISNVWQSFFSLYCLEPSYKKKLIYKYYSVWKFWKYEPEKRLNDLCCWPSKMPKFKDQYLISFLASPKQDLKIILLFSQ
jgi:hypothetical protein